MTHSWELSAGELATKISMRELSPLEVLESVAKDIESVDARVHAFCTLNLDEAWEEAARVQTLVEQGRSLGRLAGVPVGVKDLLCTKNIRTTFGSVVYESFIPDEDDVVVERLREAHAIIIGKTNVPEFGYSGASHNSLFPATKNPWDARLTSGGSSAGAAAAVATGMGPVGVGTDGGGSIRIPAAFCGIYGLKPSMGRVPLYPGCRDERYPGVSSWESLEHAGPLTRTVADAALVLSVISGSDDRDRHSIPSPDFASLDEGLCDRGISGWRVAYSRDWGYASIDPEVREVVDDAVRCFESDLGCHVEEADPGWDDPREAFRGLVALDTDLRGMRSLTKSYRDRLSSHLVAFLDRQWTAEELSLAIAQRKAVCNKMWRFMRRYDILLTPTVAVPPFSLYTQGPDMIDGHPVAPSDWSPFTFVLNMTGQPAASIPAGWTRSGLPVGLQIVGKHLDDKNVLRASAVYENARPWRHRWPKVARDARGEIGPVA